MRSGLPLLFLLHPLVACDGGLDASDAADSGDRAPTVIPANADGSIAFGDASNYSFAGALDAPGFDLQQAADVGLDWSELEGDLQCHDVDPVADIDNVALLWFKDLEESQVEEGLSNNDLQQVNLTLYLSYEPADATQFTLSQLLAFGATDPEIEPFFVENSGAWLILLTTGTTIGQGARTLAFLHPVDNGDSMGAITGGCDILDWSVDLRSLNPLGVLANGPWNLDFGDISTTGQGNEFDPVDVTEVMLARYDTLDLSALEERFLDIETLADESWSIPVESGTTLDLATLVNAEGNAFSGFDGGETWLLALRCGRCPSPAPLALTVLVPQ
jgi:hypothetical protein